MVLAPTVAPPYSDTACTPSIKALANSVGPILVSRLSRDAILLNISSSSTPEVPPIEAETASAREAKKPTGWSIMILPAKTLSAPRFIVIPQSPSPTIVSYLVRIGSASANAVAAFRIKFSGFPQKLPSNSGLFKATNEPTASSNSGISLSDGRVWLPATSTGIQAGAVVAASKHSITSDGASVKFKTVKDAPCMLKEVIKLPTRSLVTLHP
mmetsp:Transcript_275/g.372  ORF Transcript_275/g.372 Transcript_275/m.372 type:complete len:212 (-) Transcript_275:957-1592(-)